MPAKQAGVIMRLPPRALVAAPAPVAIDRRRRTPDPSAEPEPGAHRHPHRRVVPVEHCCMGLLRDFLPTAVIDRGRAGWHSAAAGTVPVRGPMRRPPRTVTTTGSWSGGRLLHGVVVAILHLPPSSPGPGRARSAPAGWRCAVAARRPSGGRRRTRPAPSPPPDRRSAAGGCYGSLPRFFRSPSGRAEAGDDSGGTANTRCGEGGGHRRSGLTVSQSFLHQIPPPTPCKPSPHRATARHPPPCLHHDASGVRSTASKPVVTRRSREAAGAHGDNCRHKPPCPRTTTRPFRPTARGTASRRRPRPGSSAPGTAPPAAA